jgi:hypothetical protein
MPAICQTYVSLKTFNEIVLGLAYAWHILSETLMRMPGICILISDPASFTLQLNRDWVAADHGFWIESVFNDQRSTQHSGFHGAPVQVPGALSLGTRRAQLRSARAWRVMMRPRWCCVGSAAAATYGARESAPAGGRGSSAAVFIAGWWQCQQEDGFLGHPGRFLASIWNPDTLDETLRKC